MANQIISKREKPRMNLCRRFLMAIVALVSLSSTEEEGTFDYSPPDQSRPGHFLWDWLPGILWGDYPKATPNI